jgi:hypothetical protein
MADLRSAVSGSVLNGNGFSHKGESEDRLIKVQDEELI